MDVVALKIVSQFGVSCSVVPRSLVKIKFQTEIPFSENKASFVHREAKVKCYLKHELTKCSCLADWLRALKKWMIHKYEFKSWPNHLFHLIFTFY